MSLELIKDAIRVNQIMGEDATQTIVENDIIVPDAKPDIARILLLDGDVYVNGAEAGQDRVLVNGSIRYKILYVPDDPEQTVRSINSSVNFSYTLDIPGTRQGMKSRIKCDIEHVEYEVINSRKVGVKAILYLEGKVLNPVEQSIARDFDGVDNMQVLRNTVSVNSYIGSSDMVAPIREALELPAGKPTIKEILRSDIKITGKDYKVTEDRVIAKGELNVSTLYIADDENNSLQFMEHEIPFTQLIDLPGVNEEAFCELDYSVADVAFEAEEDSDGELRLLKGAVDLNIFVEGFGKKDIEVIEDAYSPNVRISLEKEPFRMEEFVADNKSQVILKDTAEIPEGSPEIAEVFNVLCKPTLSDCKITDDRILVEGVMSSSVLYLANNAEQPVFSFAQEIPFKQGIDIRGVKPEMVCDIDLSVENCSYNVASANEVEIRYVIGVSTHVINEVTVPVISKAVELPPDDKRGIHQPSITIYFAQPGDSLWKIAKKYCTTVEELRKFNGLGDVEQVNPGKQILIPRKMA